MADEVNAAEAEQKAEASFGEGFGVTPPVVETAKVVEETKTESVAEAPVAAAEPAPAPAPEKPKYARVLQSDFDNLKAAAGKVASLESQVAKLTGTVANQAQLEQRIVEKIRAQTQTPAGLAVDMTDEDWAELTDAVPEIAKLTRTTLERVFKKAGVRGAAGAAEVPSFKDEDLDKALDRREAKREQDAFVKAYPEWEKIVNRVDVSKGERPDETNEFRRWLTQKGAEYQQRIAGTNSYADLHAAVDEFMASKTAPAPATKPDRGAVRRAIMEDAVAPRTDGAPPPMRPPPSADDAFTEGFKQARGRQAHA